MKGKGDDFELGDYLREALNLRVREKCEALSEERLKVIAMRCGFSEMHWAGLLGIPFFIPSAKRTDRREPLLIKPVSGSPTHWIFGVNSKFASDFFVIRSAAHGNPRDVALSSV